MSKYDEVVILVAEDDDGHAELIKEYLEDAGVNNDILRFSDGQEVWDFLSGNGKGAVRDEKQAYLLLLDINMPKMDGVEVLKKIKEDEVLMTMPVIMLTTTDDPREVEQCYKIGCNIYVTKPVDFTKFTETLKNLGLFIKVVKIG